jgi:putative hydrolase of the HAD superfamily
MSTSPGSVKAVLFDFGRVMTLRGFTDCLQAEALRQGLDPDTMARSGIDALYDSGYILGRGTEADYWDLLRRVTGLSGCDADLSRDILDQVRLDPRMISLVRELRERGFMVVLLSDHTDWLERLDARDRFFVEFDRVFNSYRRGKGKRDASLFDDVLGELGLRPAEAIFVDDDPGNVARARSRGLTAILFKGETLLRHRLEVLLGK